MPWPVVRSGRGFIAGHQDAGRALRRPGGFGPDRRFRDRRNDGAGRGAEGEFLKGFGSGDVTADQIRGLWPVVRGAIVSRIGKLVRCGTNRFQKVNLGGVTAKKVAN